MSAQDPEKLLLFPSAPTALPDELLSQFRVVSMITPDYKLMVEALLVSQGKTASSFNFFLGQKLCSCPRMP